MKPLEMGDKVRMKHHGSQATDYQQATKTGRIIRIYQFTTRMLASVTWSIGPVSEEFVEDLIKMKEPDHGETDNSDRHS